MEEVLAARAKRAATDEGNTKFPEDATYSSVFGEAVSAVDDDEEEIALIMHSRAGAPCGAPVAPVTINGRTGIHGQCVIHLSHNGRFWCVSVNCPQLTEAELLRLQDSPASPRLAGLLRGLRCDWFVSKSKRPCCPSSDRPQAPLQH